MSRNGTIHYAMATLLFWDAIRRAWGADTSTDPENWTPENPAWGQCAVTALVVQDAQGGELLRSTVRGASHYWNRLPGGDDFDLTLMQFGPEAKPDAEGEPREREYVLSFPATAARYELLRQRVGLRAPEGRLS